MYFYSLGAGDSSNLSGKQPERQNQYTFLGWGLLPINKNEWCFWDTSAGPHRFWSSSSQAGIATHLPPGAAGVAFGQALAVGTLLNATGLWQYNNLPSASSTFITNHAHTSSWSQ